MKHTSNAGGPRLPALQRISGASEWAGLGISLLTLGFIEALDALVVPLPSAFLLPPFIGVIFAGRRATALVSVLAVLCVTVSGVWHDSFGATNSIVRIALVVAGGIVACVAVGSTSEARRSMRRMELLNHLSTVANVEMPVSESLQALTTTVVPELADICMIDVLSNGEPTRAAVGAHGPDKEYVENGIAARPPTIDRGIIDGEPGDKATHHVGKVGEDELAAIAHDEKDLDFLRSIGVLSYITVPLESRGRRIGALTVVSRTRHYDTEDVKFLRVVGGRVAIAADNSGLFSDLQSVEQRMDTVMSVLDEPVLIHDRAGNAIFANEAAARTFMYESGPSLIAGQGELPSRIRIENEDGDHVEVAGAAMVRNISSGERSPRILRIIFNDGHDLWVRARSKSVPGADGRPLYVVTALENITDIKREERTQKLLSRTGDLLSTSNDVEQTVRQLARLGVPELADSCGVSLFDPGGELKLVDFSHRDEKRAVLVRQALLAAPTGGPIDGASARPVEELGIGAVMVVTMKVFGRAIGTLSFANDTGRLRFTTADRDLAEKLAERAAFAIENARTASAQAEIAETLQHSLRPDPIPSIKGWSIATLYRPAGAHNEAGGDFYDAFPVSGGWMIAIGDVTGRGAQAAAVTALARYTLRTAGVLTADPELTLSALNVALLSQPRPDLCSVALLVISGTEPGLVRIASAGHPPSLLIDGPAVLEAACNGPVLGAFIDSEWEVTSQRLEPGQQLLLYTDGVTEATGPEGRFGEERLRARLASAANPAASIEAVASALESFCEGRFDDDAAAIAIAPVASPEARLAGSPVSGSAV